jgi:nitrogen fixation/metabolism regulation signal transduction histidine kinase
VIIIQDISKLHRAQKKAAWGGVAVRMAHEIKNPLTPILLSAQRLRNKFLTR